MSVLINQFGMTTLPGVLDQRINGNVMQCRSASILVPGQAVKLTASVGSDIPEVTAAEDVDMVFGYVIYSVKKSTVAVGDIVEIALLGSVMYMTAGAAISVQTEIMYVKATGKVITAAGTTKCISGFSLDPAVADGDLARVYISSPSFKRPAA